MATDRQPPRRLGRGLAALIGDQPASEDGAEPQAAPVATQRAPIEQLRANPFQPRRQFAEQDLDDLANSIREKGILQPILVRPVEDGAFEIIAGERRWRAAQRAQLHDVPIVVRELSDQESLEIAIIENVQRADLNAVEEAAGYERLIKQFSYTQDQVSKIIGKSRSHIANTLRLLGLPDKVRVLIEDGQLSAGHARALIGRPDAEALARMAVEKGLNVREVEALVRKQDATPKSISKKDSAEVKDADTRALERTLSDALGLKVEVRFDAKKGGDLRIHYKDLEQLDEVCRRLEQRGGRGK